MNKAKIITELEDMVVARLFSRRPWLADAETCISVNRKLTQFGMLELVCEEPKTSRSTPLGKELDVDLFEVFFGIRWEDDVPIILERYRLIDESEVDAIYERMANDNAESVLIGHVKRAYFRYRNATTFLN
jgi:hypothetical protein